MAKPSYLLLGYFNPESVGESRTPALSASVDHRLFDAVVADAFGDLLHSEECDGPVYRDSNGIVTISNWRLIDRQDIATLVMTLQSQTGCECVNRVHRHSYFVAPGNLRQHFHHYNVEFKKTLAWWQEFREVLNEMRESDNPNESRPT